MKKELKAKFKELGVLAVYLFGSRAMGKKSPLSDTDIGIVFKTIPTSLETRAIYNRLYKIFSELYPDSKLDIVLLQTGPLALQFFAIKDGKILFEEDRRFTADYEDFVIKRYLDFRPVLDFFDRVATEKYAQA